MPTYEVRKKIRIPSIVGRLTGWFSVSLFIILVLAVSILYFSLSRILAAEDNGILHDRVEAVTTILKDQKDPLASLKQRIELEWATRRSEHIYIKITTKDTRRALVESPKIPHDIETEVIPQLASRAENVLAGGRRFFTSEGHSYLALVRNIDSREEQLGGGVLFAVLSLDVEQEILNKYRDTFIGIMIVMLLISILLGYRLAKFSFEPVNSIITTTRRIRSTSLNERIEEVGLPVELKNLATTINEMLDRLEESFERLSRFSSDIAHEFRTPINNIQGEVEVALRLSRSEEEYRDVLLSVHEETGRIAKMVESLLFLARAENPDLHPKYESFNLKDELANIYDFYEASAQEEGIDIRIAVPNHLTLSAERTLFQRAVSNLLSNAINHTSRGGQISISATAENGAVKLAVEDTGKGISQTDLPLIFDRFYRVDPSRTTTKLGGFGLGLTIVKTIMQLHHGSVEVESELGKGTKVTLIFPQFRNHSSVKSPS